MENKMFRDLLWRIFYKRVKIKPEEDAFGDLGIAINNLKDVLRPYLESGCDKLERFIDKFWPGLSKEKDD